MTSCRRGPRFRPGGIQLIRCEMAGVVFGRRAFGASARFELPIRAGQGLTAAAAAAWATV